MEDRIANILGTEYKIILTNEHDDPRLENIDGYTDTSVKEIVVEEMSGRSGDIDQKKNLKEYRKSVLRHEIIHGFLYESGLDANAASSFGAWATNEEMVDWFAIQSPKIFKVFRELEIL